ncbi:sigma-70 family RNA polymerase sigma factor [Phycicoccus sp. Root563]|uniref:sigma-70 family RNA polymerase sigma factor n=1 Tax=Phycicoccus sp. Root563 TaxID=1736562 RepID=UPI000A437C61|nr:sigma-70 family RNA polymerase sigma factor [Phycicoccus sp. Root563]
MAAPLQDLPHPAESGPDDLASRHDLADRLLARAEGCGDADTVERLRQEAVLLTLDLPERVARRYGGRGIDTDDLVQVGRMALVKAAHGYRVGAGNGFASYALPTILGEVKRHFRDTGWAVRPPRRLQEVRVQVIAEEDRLSQDLHRWPTPAELAQALAVDVEEVRSARLSGAAYTAVSLDLPTEDGGGVDVVARESADVDHLLRLQVVRQGVEHLSERERLIVHLRFVEERTQSEIGRVLGVSQMQVSRLLTAIIAGLRRELVDVAAAA